MCFWFHQGWSSTFTYGTDPSPYRRNKSAPVIGFAEIAAPGDEHCSTTPHRGAVYPVKYMMLRRGRMEWIGILRSCMILIESGPEASDLVPVIAPDSSWREMKANSFTSSLSSITYGVIISSGQTSKTVLVGFSDVGYGWILVFVSSGVRVG